MGTKSKAGQASAMCPRILRYCRRCGHETTHEIHTADGLSVTVCVRCVERALLYELERD
jgi:hypothetical protein